MDLIETILAPKMIRIPETRSNIHRMDENVKIMWDTLEGHGFRYGPKGEQMTAHSPGKRADCRKCRDGIKR